MAALDLTAITPVLKEIYPDGAPPQLVYKNNPFFAMVPKFKEAYGESYKVPLIYGNPQGRSATFATAQTNQTAGKYGAFDVTVVSDYATAQITGEVIDKTRNDKGAFVRAVKSEMDGALNQLTRSIAHSLYNNGGGAIGQIATTATVASATLILSNPEDVVHFEIGQVIAAASTDGTSGSLRTGTATISAIDRSAGTITTAGGNWSTQITSLATSDYLFVSGDFGGKAKGLNAWCPSSAPSSTSFFGMDRSVDTDRLGGIRYDGSSQAIEEALQDGCERAARGGGQPDIIFCHPKQVANLSKALGSKAMYDKRYSDVGNIGFRTIKIDTPVGTVDVVPDINCQPAVAWGLQMDTWVLISLGDTPKMLDDDGMAMLRTASSDAVELRCVSRHQLACRAPGFNVRIALPA